MIPGFAEFDSDKEKEKNLNARPYDFSEHDVTNDGDVYKDFVAKVEEFKPDLLALSCTEDMYPVADALLEKVADKKIPTILGGVFATFAPHLAIENPHIDIVCVGEGESALIDLAYRMATGQSYDSIPNLWIKREDGVIKKNNMGKPIDMSMNPLLDMDIFEKNRLYRPMQGKVWKMFPVETHRGCPYTCAFCNSPSQDQLYRGVGGGGFFRKKSFEDVRKELLFFKEENELSFSIFGQTPFLLTPIKRWMNSAKCTKTFEFHSGSKPDQRPLKAKNDWPNSKKLASTVWPSASNTAMKSSEEKTVNRKISNKRIIDALKVPAKLGIPSL